VEIGLNRNALNSSVLSETLTVTKIGLDRATAEALVERAHSICAYSKRPSMGRSWLGGSAPAGAPTSSPWPCSWTGSAHKAAHVAEEFRTMIEIIALALVPIFFVIALGYFAGRRRAIDNHHVGELNALVMQFALPASLFVATASTPRSRMLGEGSLFLVLGLVMMALYAAWYGLARIQGKATRQEAAVQALTVSLPNYAAAGLPIILAVVGPAGAVHVAVAIAAGSILPSTVTLFILELAQPNECGDGARRALLGNALSRALLKPILLAPLAGTAISLSGLHLDNLVISSLQLIGAAAGGVALFLTGLVLSSQPFRLDLSVAIGTLAGNIVKPALVWVLTLLIPVPPDLARVAILLSALPVGCLGILFGVSYRTASLEAGSMVIASTVFSVVTLGVLIALLYPA
jgi:malonate transporter